MAREGYEAQVELLLRVMPHVAGEEIFALKGGTAINLFYRDLPRLSVDIDLTYLPVQDRAESLAAINEALDRIADAAARGIQDAKVRRGAATVKIETSPVLRGVVHEPQRMPVTESVEDRFGFAEINVVSFEDLYAGKLIAALDRQHPRDLFDVKLLYENEGLTAPLLRTALVYIASSRRPPHELLDPGLKDIAGTYAREFKDMTTAPVALDDLLATRAQLIADMRNRLDEPARTFLRALHDGTPDFATIGHPAAADLPAVRHKLGHIRSFKMDNPHRHAAQAQALDLLLG